MYFFGISRKEIVEKIGQCATSLVFQEIVEKIGQCALSLIFQEKKL